MHATHNARFVDGVQVISGATVVVGDTGGPTAGEVTYDLLCRRHWMEGAQAARGANSSCSTSTPVPATTLIEADPSVDSRRCPDTLHATQNAGESS